MPRPDPENDPVPDPHPHRLPPDAWAPSLGIHLYDFGYPVGSDLQALTATIQPLFAANASLEVIISQTEYRGRIGIIPATFPALSVGIWSTQSRSPEEYAARSKALVAIRSSNQDRHTAEILIAADLIRQKILDGIPQTVPANFSTASLHYKDATPTAPADFLVSVAYDSNIPIIGGTSYCTSVVTFRAAGGMVTIHASPAQCDNGIFNMVLRSLFLPGGIAFGLASVIYIVADAISHLGSGSPAGSGDGAPSLGSGLFPSEILTPQLKFKFTYFAPTLIPSLGGGNFRFPFTWEPAARTPSLSLRGPTVVLQRGDERPTRFEAVPVDMIHPSFRWFVDDQPVPGGAVAMIDLTAPGLRAGQTRTFKVRVQAVEPPGPGSASTTAELVVTARLAPGPVHRWEP